MLLTTLSLYRRHYSTEAVLLQTMDCAFKSSDQGQPSLLVSLDMSAAFETIDHSTLLNRLQIGFEVEMCMGMGKIGIPWVPWDSHGNGNNISHGMGMGIKCMGMGLITWEWENTASTSNSVFVA